MFLCRHCVICGSGLAIVSCEPKQLTGFTTSCSGVPGVFTTIILYKMNSIVDVSICYLMDLLICTITTSIQYTFEGFAEPLQHLRAQCLIWKADKQIQLLFLLGSTFQIWKPEYLVDFFTSQFTTQTHIILASMWQGYMYARHNMNAYSSKFNSYSAAVVPLGIQYTWHCHKTEPICRS